MHCLYHKSHFKRWFIQKRQRIKREIYRIFFNLFTCKFFLILSCLFMHEEGTACEFKYTTSAFRTKGLAKARGWFARSGLSVSTQLYVWLRTRWIWNRFGVSSVTVVFFLIFLECPWISSLEVVLYWGVYYPLYIYIYIYFVNFHCI